MLGDWVKVHSLASERGPSFLQLERFDGSPLPGVLTRLSFPQLDKDEQLKTEHQSKQFVRSVPVATQITKCDAKHARVEKELTVEVQESKVETYFLSKIISYFIYI